MDLDELLAEDMDWQGAAQSHKPSPEGKRPQDLDQRRKHKMDSATSQKAVPAKHAKPKKRKAA
jgi:hypothetical protein